jgi:uncharacterized membrane protein YphA (DoxX/SURF4 family)
MGVATSFILGLFLRIFQFISFYFLFFPYFLKKLPQAFGVRAFACHFFKSPHTITSGLLYSENTSNLKITPRFSIFGGSHD